MPEIKPGIYQHYKGGKYRVLHPLVHHSETLEDMVVYQALYESEDFGKDAIWVRPAGMFLEEVEVGGKIVPRFKIVE